MPGYMLGIWKVNVIFFNGSTVVNTSLWLLQDTQIFGITWATFCNNQVECYDGLDERGCKFSIWLIPSLVCGAAIFLCLTLSCYILKKIKDASNEILQDRQWRLATSQPIENRATKLLEIASLTHRKESYEIQNIFKREINTNENEGEAICYLKVHQIFVAKYLLWLLLGKYVNLHMSLLHLGLIGSCGICKFSRQSCS